MLCCAIALLILPPSVNPSTRELEGCDMTESIELAKVHQTTADIEEVAVPRHVFVLLEHASISRALPQSSATVQTFLHLQQLQRCVVCLRTSV